MQTNNDSHNSDCCTNDDDRNCCVGFLKICGYLGLAGLSMLVTNHLVVVSALIDANLNGHQGVYDQVPDLDVVVTQLAILECAFAALGLWLVRSGLLRTKAFVGVLGAQMFWVCLIHRSFVDHLTEDDGRYFRCTGEAPPENDGAPPDQFDYDPAALDECVSRLDDAVLHVASRLAGYGCLGGLALIALASLATWRHHPQAVDGCEAASRLLLWLGEVAWYLVFPVAATVFIFIAGDTNVIVIPLPRPAQATATLTDTQRLRQASAVDSSSDQV